METHEIDIEVTIDGQVNAHIKGAKGPVCLQYAELLTKVMGAEGEITLTSEYYEPPTGVEIKLESKNC